MAYKTGNPALTSSTFDNLGTTDTPMTLEGSAAKAMLLLAVCVASGAFGWKLMLDYPHLSGFIIFGGLIVALILSLIIVFAKKTAPALAPVYAVAEGLVVGAISQLYNAAFDGIVLQALLITMGIFVSMLVIYRARLIRATENFKLGVAAATMGIFVYYLANLVVNFWGIDLPLINSSSVWGIGLSVFVVILAALNLVLDFDFIEKGVEQKAPKYMEWYAGFGLLVTVVWLYLEILRLLAKSRD